MLIGRKTSAGTTRVALAPNTKRTALFNMPAANQITKLAAYVDTIGASGPVRAKAVAYDSALALLGAGDEVLVPAGMAPGWLDFPFTAAHPFGLAASAGDIRLGLHVGDTGLGAYQTPSPLLVEDAFVRADQGPPPSSSYTSFNGGLKVASNRLVTAGTAGQDSVARYDVDLVADQVVQATVAVKPGHTNSVGLLARMGTTGALNGYALRAQEVVAGTDVWTIWKVVAGAWTQLGATVNQEYAVNDKITFVVVGNVLSGYQNGTLVISRTDSTFAGAGRGGLYITGGTAGALDDFSAEVVPGRTNADTYSDGPSDPFGAADNAAIVGGMAVYASTFGLWTPPNDVEMLYGRLPWAESQQVFAATGPRSLSATAGTVAWHGTRLDPERGAFCVAQTGGKFDANVGDRLKIETRGTLKKRVVYVFVHNLADIQTDLSLPRRPFAELAFLGQDQITCTVTVMV